MGKELEHIDALFRDKLKNYREPTSREAWDRLSAMLDAKDKGSNTKSLGKWGLLSLITLSFIFIFPGHNTNLIQAEQQVNAAPPKIEKKAPQLITIEKAPTKPKAIEQAITNDSPEKEVQNAVEDKKDNLLLKVEKKVNEQLIINPNSIEEAYDYQNNISIKKKPALVLYKKRERARGAKGIKVEITLDETQKEEAPNATAPQTKRTINSIFRKLRKISEASKRN